MPQWSKKFKVFIASFIRPSLHSEIMSVLILCGDDVSLRESIALAIMVEALALIISMVFLEKHSMLLTWFIAIFRINNLHGFGFWEEHPCQFHGLSQSCPWVTELSSAILRRYAREWERINVQKNFNYGV